MTGKRLWNAKMEAMSEEELDGVRVRKSGKQLAYVYEKSEFCRTRVGELQP
jgi:hypothetical protein